MPLPLLAIAAVVSAASAVGTGVKGASDADKKRYFETQLAFLNNEEKQKLEKKLREAKSDEERLKIFGSTIDAISAARVKGLSTVQVEKEKTKKQLITIGIVGGALVLITLLVVSRRQ